MAAHRLTANIIEDENALRSVIGHPTAIVCGKVTDRLNALTRRYIEQAPLVMLATSDAEGRCDVSPRGDPPGFVRVLDEHTLLMPERPGNRIADTLTNVLANPRIGLLFIIPGVTETFRVNGRASITDDAELLTPCAVEGKVPRLGLLIDIEQAYTQCSKAMLRSRCWEPERFLDAGALPTNGEIHRAIHGADFDAETYDRERAERYARREGFY